LGDQVTPATRQVRHGLDIVVNLRVAEQLHELESKIQIYANLEPLYIMILVFGSLKSSQGLCVRGKMSADLKVSANPQASSGEWINFAWAYKLGAASEAAHMD